MKIWNIAKNVMLSSALTMLYAIWCRESFHEITFIHQAVILILVWALILHLIFFLDSEVKKLNDERRKKRGRRNEN